MLLARLLGVCWVQVIPALVQIFYLDTPVLMEDFAREPHHVSTEY